MNDFVTESDAPRIARTRTEIFYNSDGTKVETLDADGNRIKRYDSTSGDPASLNNICSLVQDVQISSAE